MTRYGRSRFIAFGLLPALNAAALLIYGLHLATAAASGGAGRSLPVLIVLAILCLLMAMAAAVKRGRDVGWPWWATLLAFWFGLSTAFLFPVLIGYFAFAETKPKAEQFGPASPSADLFTWSWAVMNLIWPWVVLAFLAKVL